MTFRSGLLLFPDVTQLDLTGPYEVLARLPGAEVHLVAKDHGPVRTEHGLTLLPTRTYADCPALDLLCVPGGFGVNALMEDPAALRFVRHAAREARYVASVCTGSLVLGAAGLLKGRRAACHWLSRDFLAAFGAEPVAERVVVDGNLITGGGVTAGIDMALWLVERHFGAALADRVAVEMEHERRGGVWRRPS